MAARVGVCAVALLLLASSIAFASAEKTSTTDPDDLSKVQKLTFENFDKIVTASLLPWIINIRPGKSKEAKELAESLEGLARVGTIDTKHEKDLLKFLDFQEAGDDVSVWRAYIFGKTGEDKKFSDHDTSAEAKAAVLKSVPKDLVTEIASESALQPFLQSALANARVPVVMFTTKKGVPELVLKSAMWTSEHYALAVFPNADEQAQKNFHISRVPTLVMIMPVIDEKSGKISFSPIEYQREHFGGLQFLTIIKFLATARAELTQAGRWPKFPKRPDPADKQGQQQQQQKSTPPPVEVPPEPIFEVTAATPSACSDSMLGLCVLLLLDNSPLNKEAKEDQLKLLEKVQYSPAQKGRPLHFMWVDAMCHKTFAEALDVSLESLPAVVAFAPKKKKQAHMIGAFSQTSVSTFISQVLAGQVPLAEYKSFPNVSKDDDCEKYYKDQTSVVDEEFDLSDIIGKPEERTVEERAADEDAQKRAAAAAAAIEAAEKEEKMRIVREELERLNKKKKSSSKSSDKKKTDDSDKKKAEDSKKKAEGDKKKDKAKAKTEL